MKIFVVHSIFVDEVNNNTELNDAVLFNNQEDAVNAVEKLIEVNSMDCLEVKRFPNGATIYFDDNTWYEVRYEENNFAERENLEDEKNSKNN